MAIITRQDKGSKLTISEVDNNFTELSSRVHIDIIPPTIYNDSAESFIVNKSIWIDIVTLKTYKCTDATVMGAVWEEFTIGTVDFIDSFFGEAIAEAEGTINVGSADVVYQFLDTNKVYLLELQLVESTAPKVFLGRKYIIQYNSAWISELANTLLQIGDGYAIPVLPNGATDTLTIAENGYNLNYKYRVRELI